MGFAACSMPSAAMAVLLVIAPASAHPSEGQVQAEKIISALKGKVCTTKGGATFTFRNDGHYAYDGMWTDSGHYSVRDGAVTILLDSGLEKEFAVSRRDGVLYLEQTAVRCALRGEAWGGVGGREPAGAAKTQLPARLRLE
jgi:hypothetical protein